MAKGMKTGGRNFGPGHKGGRPKTPADVKRARKLTSIAFTRLCNRFLGMTRFDLAKAVNDQGATALELLVASIVHSAVSEADERKATFLLERMIGKVTDRIEHSGKLSLAELVVEAHKRQDGSGEGEA
jgi:hypothetical protein